MRIRDATGLVVALACGALGACADASGIVLTVQPASDGSAELVDADTLVVYVGYGDTTVTPLGQSAIHLHVDDGAARALALDAPFDAPIEVLLDGPESGEPFYVAIRAEQGGQVIGEGGVDGTLTLVDGKVTTAVAEVGAPLSRTMPNCPGFRVSEGRHYLVSTDRDDDCDADGERAIEGGGPDCNDFDAAFNTGADDQNCDELDHTCGNNTNQSDAACVVEEHGTCWLGAQTCRDGEGGTGECVAISTAPLPQVACDQCEGMPDLEACLPAEFTAVCAIKRQGIKVCLPAPRQGAFTDEQVWWHDNAPGQQGSAKWLDFPRVPEYEFAWVAAPNLLAPMAEFYPGSPALTLLGPATQAIHTFTKFVAASSSTGDVTLYRIAFTVEEGSCPDEPDAEPDCIDFPAAGLQ